MKTYTISEKYLQSFIRDAAHDSAMFSISRKLNDHNFVPLVDLSVESIERKIQDIRGQETLNQNEINELVHLFKSSVAHMFSIYETKIPPKIAKVIK